MYAKNLGQCIHYANALTSPEGSVPGFLFISILLIIDVVCVACIKTNQVLQDK